MAGVGKTCLKHLLMEIPPPENRHSTPCAEKPTRINIRPISASKLKVKAHGRWNEVSLEELLKLVAELIPECERFTNLSKQVSKLVQQISAHTPDISNSRKQPKMQIFTPDQNTIMEVPNKDVRDIVAKIKEKLILLISQSKDDSNAHKEMIELFTSTWVYLTDCGGQPQFHHLFPLFVRNISAALFVMKLPERLDSYAPAPYYNCGKLVGVPLRSTLTTIDTLKCFYQSIQAHRSGSGEKPKLLVVGTHRDEMEGRSKIKKENEKLLQNEFPQSSKNINMVYYKPELHCKRVIFPVNTAKPRKHETKIAEMIRKEVENSVVAVEEKVPVLWYVLELILQELAQKHKQVILSRSDCLEIARVLHLNDDIFYAALKFFDALCVFHYYPDTLPEVVFINSQVPVDIISKLVECSFLLRKKPVAERQESFTTDNESTSSDSVSQSDSSANEDDPDMSSLSAKHNVSPSLKSDMQSAPRLYRGNVEGFRDHGIISLQILQNPCFEAALKLLNKLLVVAPIPEISQAAAPNPDADQEYLMPSLLEVGTGKLLGNQREFTDIADPLLFKFPDGVP